MFFFLSWGGGGVWEVVVGVYRSPHLIFTLFQSNIYKVNVREFLPRDLCRENGQPLTLWWFNIKPMLSEGSHVFEVSVLRFFIVFFKRFYDEYLVGSFFTICWSLNLWMIFSLPKRDGKSLCVCGWSVCVHPLKRNFSQAVIGTFYQCHFSLCWSLRSVSNVELLPCRTQLIKLNSTLALQ